MQESRLRLVRGAIRRCIRRTRLIVLSAPRIEQPSSVLKGYNLFRMGVNNSSANLDIAEEAMQAAGESAGLVQPRLANGDQFFGWEVGERVVSFGWVTFRNRVVGLYPLKEVAGRVFLYNFHTLSDFRGRGLYPALLLAIRETLCNEGVTETIIDVEARNAASRKGIEKAGFAPAVRTAYITILNRWRVPLGNTILNNSASPLL